MANIATKTFTSSSSWTAPAGVTRVQVRGWGGGGFGVGGFTAPTAFGSGGQSSYERTLTVTVVPNTSYTVTIGAGGTWSGEVSGTNTTFGSLATFHGAGDFAEDSGSDSAMYTGEGAITFSGSQVEGYNPYGFASYGADDGSHIGGGPGADGPGGGGGNGGAGNASGTGTAGANAAGNTGAGGGGGGASSSGTSNGGTGGTGQLELTWSE